MELSVEINGKRETANIIIAGKNDFGFVPEWVVALGDDQNPKKRDALQFAEIAVHRFVAHSVYQPYAKDINEIKDYIADNPRCEVPVFALLKSSSLPELNVLGMVHFRRTWAENIVLDYASAHPSIVKMPPGFPHKVRGVGIALMYFVCQVAKRYNCGLIWGEATQHSNTFYQDQFELDPLQDLIYVPHDKYIEYIERTDRDWAENKIHQMTIKNSSLDRKYALEQRNPPVLGNKAVAFDPFTRLSARFLTLQTHEQVEIIEVLKLGKVGDHAVAEAGFLQGIFKKASETGKLGELWHEVESRHVDGDQESNPFSGQ